MCFNLIVILYLCCCCWGLNQFKITPEISSIEQFFGQLWGLRDNQTHCDRALTHRFHSQLSWIFNINAESKRYEPCSWRRRRHFICVIVFKMSNCSNRSGEYGEKHSTPVPHFSFSGRQIEANHCEHQRKMNLKRRWVQEASDVSVDSQWDQQY